ncbi:uncharacterized protein LOC128235256 [Mya arenaria]|uniref:uncharacterized protein LOC128235256 n=1 Tax=Mya arenaria TaxID=6604 RepID=UPI0022E93414|nr:uncharacterized protein LOC128235256 [Mya arenaria]
MMEDLHKLQDDIKRMKKENSDLSQQVLSKKLQIISLTDGKYIKEKKIHDNIKQMKEENFDLSQQVKSIKEEITSLKNEKRQIEEKHQDDMRQIQSEAEQTKKKHQDDMRQIQSEAEQTKKKYEDVIGRMEPELLELDRQMESLRKLNDTDEKQQKYENIIGRMEAELLKLHRQIESFRKLNETDKQQQELNEGKSSKTSRIPATIQDFESYGKIQKVQLAWICNFEAQDDIAKALQNGESNIADLLDGTELNIQKGDFKQYMRTGTNTCEQLIQKKLKNKNNTDCFIWIISSYSTNENICYKNMEESISKLAILDNENFSEKMRNKPKILVFDLYEKPVTKSATTDSYQTIKIHRDWLIVIARNREDGSFIKTLKREITAKYNKLDFVSILECVKRSGVDMKILHRMPRKLFLGDVKLKLETELMSHYEINDDVRCCFFGSSEFNFLSSLRGVHNDQELVNEMSNKTCFKFKNYQLENAENTIKSFTDELKKTCGCHMFVFSSHGSSDGVITKNEETVQFRKLIEEINKRSTKHPVILLFDCCRTLQEQSTPGGKSGQVKPTPEDKMTADKPSQLYYAKRNGSIAKKRLKMKDLIIVHAAVKGYPSFMNKDNNASVFTEVMCDVIGTQLYTSDFVSMMECVNRRICESINERRQTCVEIESQLTKKLFLFETETES